MSYRIKLDENFSPNLTVLFTQAGYDTHSVRDESLNGTMDEHLYEVICREQRCLITFDLDFCNILRYPTVSTNGIIVVRPHRPLSLQIIRDYAKKDCGTPTEPQSSRLSLGAGTYPITNP
jgi:hypothetical protein